MLWQRDEKKNPYIYHTDSMTKLLRHLPKRLDFGKMPKIGRNSYFYAIMALYEWKAFFRTTVSTPPLLGQPYQIKPYGPPRADRWEPADNHHRQWWWIGLCMFVVAIWSDRRQKITFKMIKYFRSTSYLVKLFSAKEFALLTRRAIETTKRRNSRSKQKKIVYGTEPFLSDGPVDKSTVSSKFRRFAVCRVVVSLFCDRDRRTK